MNHFNYHFGIEIGVSNLTLRLYHIAQIGGSPMLSFRPEKSRNDNNFFFDHLKTPLGFH